MKKTTVLLLFFSVFLFAYIKIGLLAPLTGSHNYIGQYMKNGITVAQIYKPTVLGQRVEIIYGDTGSTVEGTKKAVEYLISQGVTALIGEYASARTIVAAEMLEKAKIPLVNCISTNPNITKGRQYVTRISFNDETQGKALAELTAKNLRVTKVAVLTDEVELFSVELSKIYINHFSKYSKDVKEFKYNKNQQNFSKSVEQMSKQIFDFKPQAVVFTGYTNEIALFLIALDKLGYRGYKLSSTGVASEQLVKLAGKSAEGVLITNHFHFEYRPTKTTKIFTKLYTERYGLDVSIGIAPLVFDSYLLILDAIERSKSFEKDKIAIAIRNTKNFQGATGLLTVDPLTGENTKDLLILRILNGKTEYLMRIPPDYLDK